MVRKASHALSVSTGVSDHTLAILVMKSYRRANRLKDCGFGAATRDLSAPNIEWRGQDTFIQKEGIVDDFGIFDDPDAFYARHGTNLSGPKRWLFVHAIRRWMNDNVARVRAGRW